MKTKLTSSNTVKVWISAAETYQWAHKQGAKWPCSTLEGRKLYAHFAENGDLLDVTIDGREPDPNRGDIDGQEFNALMSDFLTEYKDQSF